MSLFTLFTVLPQALGGVASPIPVHMAQAVRETVDCSQIVDDILLETDGRLLSVRSHPDRCTVTVLVVREGQRPERKVFRVSITAGKGIPK